jgi:hypothetical protein
MDRLIFFFPEVFHNFINADCRCHLILFLTFLPFNNCPMKHKIFSFEYLHPLLGKKITDSEVAGLLQFIHEECRNNFVIQEPPIEEILTDNDKWKNYDSQKLGLAFEIVNNVFACISFFSSTNTYNSSLEIRIPYPYSLLKDLSVNSNRDDVRKSFGLPSKHNDIIDQFPIDDSITMGVIYNETSGKTSVVSYGITSIFSNPDKCPNRYSFIFWSLS